MLARPSKAAGATDRGQHSFRWQRKPLTSISIWFPEAACPTGIEVALGCSRDEGISMAFGGNSGPQTASIALMTGKSLVFNNHILEEP